MYRFLFLLRRVKEESWQHWGQKVLGADIQITSSTGEVDLLVKEGWNQNGVLIQFPLEDFFLDLFKSVYKNKERLVMHFHQGMKTKDFPRCEDICGY